MISTLRTYLIPQFKENTYTKASIKIKILKQSTCAGSQINNRCRYQVSSYYSEIQR